MSLRTFIYKHVYKYMHIQYSYIYVTNIEYPIGVTKFRDFCFTFFF